jgi:hypothetical protein
VSIIVIHVKSDALYDTASAKVLGSLPHTCTTKGRVGYVDVDVNVDVDVDEEVGCANTWSDAGRYASK